VSVMVVQAGAAEGVLDRDPEAARAALGAIRSSGKTALVELRRMLGLLRADALAPTGASPSLARVDSLIAQIRQAGLGVELEVNGAAFEAGARAAGGFRVHARFPLTGDGR